jgi:hypothetical protein
MRGCVYDPAGGAPGIVVRDLFLHHVQEVVAAGLAQESELLSQVGHCGLEAAVRAQVVAETLVLLGCG